jgi:hypothetical protein
MIFFAIRRRLGPRSERIEQVGLISLRLGADFGGHTAFAELKEPLRGDSHSFRIQIVAEETTLRRLHRTDPVPLATPV